MLLQTTPLAAQGFAGLGADADGFAIPHPGAVLEFPADHGAHPDYRIEWWYLTATLKGDDGDPYGVQWTLFRSALRPDDGTGWQTPQLWMGHAAVTTRDQHHVAERLARGGIGQAGVTASPFAAWIDDWEMKAHPDTGISELTLSARGETFRYELALSAKGPLVLHGDQGYSVKSADGQASYYYSQPAYDVSGTLFLPDGPVEVTGQGWLDREWSTQPLSPDQTGWDWFSLSFDSGARMMGFQLRDSGAGYTSATWIGPDGQSQSFSDGALDVRPLKTERVSGRDIPMRWRVSLPDQGLDVEVAALNLNSWMDTSFPYWEGPVTISGSHSGQGYLEMTGYD
ncbi:lipocalin-like domain-containing protein [Sedimentitalea sp. JM2-8]|uniref:Lipocalin-like domain-containing protein n=2 Tax=Sedimentitalea xiamensis TaxID=3050037 RepID=A0ABT7FBV6_9RHOB|nr:lipocalin-like domain-containing protein [Sedimentitalea xiamensis]MDK3072597.1 lipocalin-like domain-containing protein [Sedimentitalea xiamensis]